MRKKGGMRTNYENIIDKVMTKNATQRDKNYLAQGKETQLKRKGTYSSLDRQSKAIELMKHSHQVKST